MTATPAAPRRHRRWVAVAVVVVLFLLISAFLSRWLGTENAERAADHARRMAERLDHQEASVRRFLELSGDDLPETG